MISSVGNISSTVASFNRAAGGVSSTTDTSTSTRDSDPLDIRIFEPRSNAKLYSATGLLSGQPVPGGTGIGRRMEFNGEILAGSEGSIFPVRELPAVPMPSNRVMERIGQNEQDSGGLAEKLAALREEKVQTFGIPAQEDKDTNSILAGLNKQDNRHQTLLDNFDPRDSSTLFQEESSGLKPESIGGYQQRSIQSYQGPGETYSAGSILEAQA